jgi:hypothetical protein
MQLYFVLIGPKGEKFHLLVKQGQDNIRRDPLSGELYCNPEKTRWRYTPSAKDAKPIEGRLSEIVYRNGWYMSVVEATDPEWSLEMVSLEVTKLRNKRPVSK